MISTIFFDLDWVLTTNKNGSSQLCSVLSREGGIDYDHLYSTYYSLSLDLLLWKKKFVDIWEELCTLSWMTLALSDLPQYLAETPRNVSMFDLAQELKVAWYKCWVITDNPGERVDVLAEVMNFWSYFDTVVVSADVWWLKHGEEIFTYTCEKVWVAPDECVFIDNSPKNLVVPKDLWFEVFHHDDAQNDIPKLRTFLVSLWLLTD